MRKIKTTGTQEMYLIYIKRIAKARGNVRIVDIVNESGTRKSTVHEAVQKLISKNLVFKNQNDIMLTNEGLRIVENLEEKHENIYSTLRLLGATHEMAEQNAGLIEHIITDDLLDVLSNFVKANSEK